MKVGICNATAKTKFYDLKTILLDTVVDVTLRKEHLHAPDEVEVEVREVVNQIRERARSEPNETPGVIIREVVNEIDDEELLQRLPEKQALMLVFCNSSNFERHCCSK